VNPVLRGEVVERQQFVDVVGDLPGRLGSFRTVGLLERGDGLEGVLAVLGVVDVLEYLAGAGLGRRRQSIEDIGRFVNPAPLVAGFGEHLCEGFPEAERAVADGEDGARIPRRAASRSRSAQDSADSR
jgi:hypothetical protein